MGFEEDDPFSKLDSNPGESNSDKPKEDIPLEILDEHNASDDEDDDPFDRMEGGSTFNPTPPATADTAKNPSAPAASDAADPFAQLPSPVAQSDNPTIVAQAESPQDVGELVDLSTGLEVFARNDQSEDLHSAPSDAYGEGGMSEPFIPGADPELAPPSGHDVTPEQPDPFSALAEQLKRGKEAIQDFQDKTQEILDMTGVSINDAAPSDIMEKQEKQTKSYFQLLEEKLFPSGQEKYTPVDPEENIQALKKLDYLKGKIKIDSLKYRGWGRKSRQWALTFRLLSSALAAVVTVLLGINITDTLRDWAVDWWVNTIALVISAFISIIGVIQGFFDANELYIKYLDTANQLERLASTVEYLELSGPFISIDHVNAIKIEHDRILKSMYDYEVQIRAADKQAANEIQSQGIANSSSNSNGAK